jgi:hypothetical protein
MLSAGRSRSLFPRHTLLPSPIKAYKVTPELCNDKDVYSLGLEGS